MLYLGLDVHSKWTCVKGMDPESGRIVDIKRMSNEEASVRECLEGLPGPLYGALEAGTNSWAMYRVMRPYFARLVVVDPASVWDRKRDREAKTDSRDALRLAEKLYRGHLDDLELYVPDERVQDLRCLVRFKIRASRLVTRLTNEIGSLVRSWGYVGSRSLLSKSGKMSLEDAQVGEHSAKILKLWRELQEKAEEIERELDAAIKEEAEADEQSRLLQTVPGVGAFTALLVRSEVGDISRFRCSDHLLSYAGLVPKVSQSAERLRYGKLVAWGNRWLKYGLCLFAQRASRSVKDSCFHRTYWRVAMKRDRNSAKVAAARQICRQLHFMLRHKVRWEDPVLREEARKAA